MMAMSADEVSLEEHDRQIAGIIMRARGTRRRRGGDDE